MICELLRNCEAIASQNLENVSEAGARSRSENYRPQLRSNRKSEFNALRGAGDEQGGTRLL